MAKPNPSAEIGAPITYCTIQDAASYLAVDPKTIRRLIAGGTLPAVRVGFRPSGTTRDKRPIRIPVDALKLAVDPMNAAASALREEQRDAANPAAA
jgi:excisionase family DNA binding protein